MKIRAKDDSDRKQTYWAVFTFFALILLVVFQVIWIIKVARLEEKNFNYRVSHAMQTIRTELGLRASGSDHMHDYLCGNECPVVVRNNKIAEIDSIIKSNLEVNHIDLDYNFVIGDSASLARQKVNESKRCCYVQFLNGVIQKEGIRLSVQFPHRNQFLIAQMKGGFILSILFIVFVAISFFISLRMFMRKRAQLIHTSDFINNMVHEFQTPLANMRLAAGLIRKRVSDQSQSKVNEYLDVIVAENVKLEKSVTDILQFAALANGIPKVSEVNIHPLIQKVVDTFSFRLQCMDAVISVQLNADRDVVKGCEEHFNLMLSNIIDNSLKYSVQKPSITVSTYCEKEMLVISISDEGIGMNEKEIPYIFDKYYRVSTGDVHNVKGFGLGLAYVKKITDLYGGNIVVNSTPHVGTTFILKFPLSHA